MSKITSICISILLVLMFGCSSDSNNSQNEKGSSGNKDAQLETLSAQLEQLPLESLSEAEASAIIFMREEEKLARDAYDLFYQIWDQNIFDNISSAEQTHMDSMLLLIVRYELVDPIVEDVPGVFVNSELQSLYDLLAASGRNSLVDALMAGAVIEEVDIIDLQLRLLESDNQDIALIFDNLMKGSRNHLRSFVSNLEKQGMSYTPQYLSQEDFDAIINSPMETGNGG